MNITTLGAIDITEKVDVRFTFASEIKPGETIQSAVISCTLKSGEDPTPAAALVGAATISNTTYDVLQRVQGRVGTVVYKLKCVATLSSGRVLTRACELPVFSY